MLTTSQSAIAPDSNRTDVKVAGSMTVCFSAARHSSELPANAIIARKVRISIRVREIIRETGSKRDVENSRQQFVCRRPPEPKWSSEPKRVRVG